MFDNCWALVVEDDAHSLVAIGAILRDLGIYYKRNTTGSAVADRIAAMEPKPNFVLLDLDLPQGDAFEIVRELASGPLSAGIPVIAIADEANKSLVARVRRAGFAGFVPKPLPRRHFGSVLERICSGESVWQTPV